MPGVCTQEAVCFRCLLFDLESVRIEADIRRLMRVIPTLDRNSRECAVAWQEIARAEDAMDRLAEEYFDHLEMPEHMSHLTMGMN
jgi:hypothetical protein